MQGIHHFQPVDTEGRLWRGAAPSRDGYRALARLGFTTVVDLRAEDLTAAQLTEPRRAGLDVTRLPIRDGQTPTPAQVRRFLDVVASAAGPVFVPNGAGVGRTGTMAAAYLVRPISSSTGWLSLPPRYQSYMRARWGLLVSNSSVGCPVMTCSIRLCSNV